MFRRRLLHKAGDLAARRFDGSARPAAILQGQARQPLMPRRVRPQVVVDLVGFASQPQNHRGRNIGMHQHAAQRAPQLIHVGTERVPAALAVGEGHHAVHVGGQSLVPVAVGDQLGGVGRAIAGRHHGDVVASAHAAVFARVAQEGGRFRRLRQRGFRRGELVLERQLFEAEVMGVDMAAGFDRRGGASDGLAVPLHHGARGDVTQRKLVAGGDGVQRHHAHSVHAQFGAGRNGHARDCHVVGGVQMNGRIFGRR